MIKILPIPTEPYILGMATVISENQESTVSSIRFLSSDIGYPIQEVRAA